MNRRQMLAAGGAAALGAALPATARAGGDKDVVGSWIATITATNPPLGSFSSLMSFHESGVFTESRRYYVVAPPPIGDLLETSGHGAWERKGGKIAVFFRFLLQRAPVSDGGPVGTDNIRLSLAAGHHGDTLSGTFESNIKDNDGNVLLTVQGTVTADRIEV